VPPVTVLLAVSDPLQQALLVRALERRVDLELIATEQDGRKALAALLDLMPDVAVVETGLPSLDGLELCRAAVRARADVGTRVLLLYGDPSVTRARAIEAGAAGCVPATATTAQVCDAISSIANGRTIFHN
jgi:DNA-binding NarL/FixJ family response regulator